MTSISRPAPISDENPIPAIPIGDRSAGLEPQASSDFRETRTTTKVVFLKGSLDDRAEQAAAVSAKLFDAHPGPLAFWNNFILTIMKNQLPHFPDAAHRHATNIIEKMLVEPLHRALPDAHKRAGAAFHHGLRAHGCSSAMDRTSRFAVIYDALNVLSGLPLRPRSPAGPLGCSSFVSMSEHTAQGHLIHGRNLDLMPHANRMPPIIAVHRPTSGLAHVSLHHSGGFTPGITAINEAGVGIGVHQNFSHNVAPSGESLIATTQELIEKCSSLSQALSFLRGRRFAGAWTLVLSDAENNRSAAVEIDADGPRTLLPPRDFLAVANCYRTRKSGSEFAFSGALREHNWSRLSLLNERANKHRGDFDVRHMQDTLADGCDAYARDQRCGFGNTVRAIHNLDAVIMSHGLDRLYVATGETPRNGSGGYAEYALSDLFAGKDRVLGHLPSTTPRNEQHALEAHSRGAAWILQGQNPEGAIAEFETARELDADCTQHSFMAAVARMQCGDIDPAAFEEIIDAETSPYRAGLSALMAGRCHDILGARTAAKQSYRRVMPLSGAVDPLLHKRARGGLRRKFTAKRAKSLIIDTCMGDIVN